MIELAMAFGWSRHCHRGFSGLDVFTEMYGWVFGLVFMHWNYFSLHWVGDNLPL